MTATSERRIRAADTKAAAAAAGRVVVSQREPAAPHVSRECKRSTVATRRKTLRRVLRWTRAARRVPAETPAAICTSSSRREPAARVWTGQEEGDSDGSGSGEDGSGSDEARPLQREPMSGPAAEPVAFLVSRSCLTLGHWSRRFVRADWSPVFAHQSRVTCAMKNRWRGCSGQRRNGRTSST